MEKHGIFDRDSFPFQEKRGFVGTFKQAPLVPYGLHTILANVTIFMCWTGRTLVSTKGNG